MTAKEAPMRRLAMWLALAFVAGPALAQENLPEFVIHSEAGPVDLRYVDFGWNPEAFAAMESGGKHPAAGRSWMLALLRLRDPVVLEGSTLPVGASLLVLNPKRGTSPMTFEILDIDMRLIWEPNVIGVPPKGETVKVVPATFEKVADTKARLEIVATAAGRDTLVVIHYGDRKATLRLKARGE
jgi:hypothetical protein